MTEKQIGGNGMAKRQPTVLRVPENGAGDPFFGRQGNWFEVIFESSYDRVAAVKELQQRHPEWKIEPAGEGGQEYILVVCGCTAVCAGHTQLEATKHKFVINSGEQFAAACEAIIKENEV